MPPYVEAINEWAQLIVTVGAVVALIKTVGQSAQAPNKTQDARLDALEDWKEKVDERLDMGSKHFNKLDKFNEVTASALIAMLDAQITGDNKVELEKAKKDLNEYLIHSKNQ